MFSNLLDRMKLPFRKNKEFLSALYDILGFYPHDLNIYRVACSHKSVSRMPDNAGSKDRKLGTSRDRRDRRDRRKPVDAPTRPLNNERLEYLGDAVLETVVSDILFRHFKTKREGFLTSTRSKIVQREALNKLAADMGLENLIIAAQGTRMSHTNIGGNAFEALMGAIYLDRGYKYCHWFISHRVIGRYVDLEKVAQKEVNFKSKLLEWVQKNRININFKDTENKDDKGFQTVIVMEGITISRGAGRSKKDSQQEASKEALTRMRREPKTYDSIFRAKEKRTAMEADESFALPKIDEIEESIAKPKGKKVKDDAPVLEQKRGKVRVSDEAYDAAYDESATYDVIDEQPDEQGVAFDYESMGLPAPPEENELLAADEKLRKKRQRNRGAKTMGDAVKGATKGASTAEEKQQRRENERMAEVERQRNKAERKRKEGEKTDKAKKEIAAKQPVKAVAEQTVEQPNTEAETAPLTTEPLQEQTAVYKPKEKKAPLVVELSNDTEESTRNVEESVADVVPIVAETAPEQPISEEKGVANKAVLAETSDAISETSEAISETSEAISEISEAISETVEALPEPAVEVISESVVDAISADMLAGNDTDEAVTALNVSVKLQDATEEAAVHTTEEATEPSEPLDIQPNDAEMPTEDVAPKAEVEEKPRAAAIRPISFDDVLFGTEHDTHLSQLPPEEEDDTAEAAALAVNGQADEQRRRSRRSRRSNQRRRSDKARSEQTPQASEAKADKKPAEKKRPERAPKQSAEGKPQSDAAEKARAHRNSNSRRRRRPAPTKE